MSLLIVFVSANIFANAVQPVDRQKVNKIFEFKTDCGFKRIKFSHDDRHFLAHCSFEPVYVWRTNGYSLVGEVKTHNGEDKDTPKSVNGAFFVPNSDRMFIGNPEGKAVIINLNAKATKTYDVSDNRSRMSGISHSGHMLALGNRLFDINKNKVFSSFDLAIQSGLLFTCDDKYFITADSLRGVYVTDTSTGSPKREWLTDSGWFSDPKVESVDVSVDSDTVAVGFDNGKIILYSIKSGARIDTLKHGRGPNVVFSPDGKLLASWSRHKKSIVLWDVGRGRQLRHWKFDSQLFCLKFFPHKELILIGTLEGELIIVPTFGETALLREKVVEKAIADIDISSSEKLIILCSNFGDIIVLELDMK